MDDFWSEYEKELNDGYFKIVEGTKCLKTAFIVDYPKKIAQELGDSKKNKSSQLWRFFDHIRQIQNRLRQGNEPFEKLLPVLCELAPASFNAETRDVVTEQFRTFIEMNISKIKNKDDLNAFIKHFQSLIAYLPKQNQ